MSKVVTQHVGPPHTPFAGMNTTARKQQVAPSQFNMLRNVDLSGETLTRRNGYYRMCAGARTATSLRVATTTANFVEIPYTDDSIAITDFNLTDTFTIFVSYSISVFPATDAVIASHSNDATPPWRITHMTTGKIVATVAQVGSTEVTLTSGSSYTGGNYEITVLLTRNKDVVTMTVNGSDTVTDTVTLQEGIATLVSTESIFLGSWTGYAADATIAYYEFRIHRAVTTGWRITQYPWSGRFGDPTLAVHLTFEDGSGTAITDWSRNNHGSIEVATGGTWQSTTKRQVTTMVNGIHGMENARGRKWLLLDIGPNHYRIPLN